MITDSVTPIPEHGDAYALGIIRLMKKSAEVNLPVVYGMGKRDLNQKKKSQKLHNGLYWSKRSTHHPQLHMSTNVRNHKKPIYWSKRSEDQDFKDFLPFSTIIRHENLMQPDELFQTNV